MPYPAPVFFFAVKSDKFTGEMGFSEVTGLNQEIQVIEYRHGEHKEPAPIKKPGLKKYNNIMFKRGIVQGNNDLFTWMNNYNWEESARVDLQVTLNNENSEPVMIWNVSKAFPTKIEGPALKASGNEIAIESMEIACEKITLELG
ncbi:MAG: phage tail protein [Lewinellaceae bacterium]|nr:phage tail protein [Saprospiraceae bacterium]MCB9314759.1 phage tail protein [Lewinellaceae bacterium]MCB9333151.1 phage tail protein [Lewinellaceae bacterium]